MKTLFHLPILPPKNPKFEAYSQEIQALSGLFDGQTIYINPNQYLPKQIPLRVPRLLFGFHQLTALRQLDRQVDLHQIYNPDPFYYPILSFLKKPVVYVVSGSLTAEVINPAFFRRVSAVAVYDQRSYQNLCNAGIQNVYQITSGIETSHFTHRPLPLDSSVHLLMASAPWSEAQFKTKGIDALLGAAKSMPKLQLTLLWRGVLREQLDARITAFGVQDQVTIIDRLADIDTMLGEVHGTVLLASSGDIVKAYPHSLLDSLAAGKPVITSRTIPMSDYVETHRLGLAVDQVDSQPFEKAVQAFVENYDHLSSNAAANRSKDFTIDRMLDSYRRLYNEVLDQPHSRSFSTHGEG